MVELPSISTNNENARVRLASQKVTSDFIPVGSSFLRKKLKDPIKPDTLSKAASVKDLFRTFIKEKIIGNHMNASFIT